ncbi:MAG: response regulator transcription factor [Campylobacterales bacterium]|nr:response regulator transcription factor [Campylobacterales bacterium]
MAAVLLLEDDASLCETLSELLAIEGFGVTVATDAHQVLLLTQKRAFDCYIFDVNVPFQNGFDLLGSLRSCGDTTPTIFITALGDISSLSRGFAVGAEDYLKKPFAFEELIIRLRALLKRTRSIEEERIHAGAFSFHLGLNLLYHHDRRLSLTAYEQKIVGLLFRGRGAVVRKEELLYALGEGEESSEGSLRVMMSHLRKLGLEIKTIRGLGYRLEAL